MQNRPSPGRPVLRCEKHHKRRIGWNGVSKKEGHAPRVTPGRGSGRVPALCHGPVFAGRATLKKGQRLAESGAFRQSDVVGRLVHCQTLAAQNRPPRPRSGPANRASTVRRPSRKSRRGRLFLPESRGSSSVKNGSNTLSSSTSAPIAGQPSASLSYCTASAARTLSAEKSAASSPAPFNRPERPAPLLRYCPSRTNRSLRICS